MGVNKLEEEHNDLKRRYNSMCEASEKNQEEIGRLTGENAALKNDLIRLGAEARMAQENAQLLGDDFNERSREFGRQITELRLRLKENGLDAEVN